MPVTIDPVSSDRELQSFIRLPFELYRGDPLFVPPLISDRKKFFGAENPLFAFTDVAYFLARDASGGVVGRITAHINKRHNEITGERTGFFGFFEAVNDGEVAEALIRTAEAWLRERGMDTIRGPFSFSTNEECGFLVDGFEVPPGFMMPYSHEYYLGFMDALGFDRLRDLIAYDFVYQGQYPEHLTRVSKRVESRTGVTVRPVDMKKFESDVATAFDLYNSAWQDNWGFIPMTEAEFHFQADDLKSIMDPQLVLLASKGDTPVGFSLTLPDLTPVFRRMNGKLFPFGVFHFLLGKRRVKKIRVMAMGLLEDYRRTGIDVLLYHHTFKNALDGGYRECEMSWILDDNTLMRRAIEKIGAKVTRTYRIFERAL